MTPAQREAGEHLKEVHDHLRENMRTIRVLIERAARGTGERRARWRDETGDLTMVSNFRRFGNLCGQHCQIVNTHHSIEDAHVFPALAAQSEGYRAGGRAAAGRACRGARTAGAADRCAQRDGDDAERRSTSPRRAKCTRRWSACWPRTSATRKSRSATRSAISGCSRTDRAAGRRWRLSSSALL